MGKIAPRRCARWQAVPRDFALSTSLRLPRTRKAREKSMHRDKLGRFARGHSGNMTGRPHGSRNKLGEVFIELSYQS